MSACVIVAGYDAQKGGQIYALPIATCQHFTASGSGSGFVSGFLDSQWRPNMTLDEIKQVSSCFSNFLLQFIFCFVACSYGCLPCNIS